MHELPICYGTGLNDGKLVSVVEWNGEVIYLDDYGFDFYFFPVWGHA